MIQMLAAVIIVLMISCVSMKKFNEQKAELNTLVARNATLETDASIRRAENTSLAAHIESIKHEYDEHRDDCVNGSREQQNAEPVATNLQVSSVKLIDLEQVSRHQRDSILSTMRARQVAPGLSERSNRLPLLARKEKR